MEDVVVPQLEPSFDVEAEKTEDVLTQEQEDMVIEKLINKEVKDKKFPVIRQEIQSLIDKYDSVSELVNVPASEAHGQIIGRAFVVSELKSLLDAIDQKVEVDDGATTQ